jgi:hypothetical protein
LSWALVRVYGALFGSATRQEPNARLKDAFGSYARITLGGKGESGCGQRRSPSRKTSYP